MDSIMAAHRAFEGLVGADTAVEIYGILAAAAYTAALFLAVRFASARRGAKHDFEV